LYAYTHYPSVLFVSAVFSFFCLSSDQSTSDIYTLSLHDALPICVWAVRADQWPGELCRTRYRRPSARANQPARHRKDLPAHERRSEEHTSELQSHLNLVCRLLLEKKKNNRLRHSTMHTYSHNNEA